MTKEWDALLASEKDLATAIYNKKANGDAVDGEELRKWWGLIENTLLQLAQGDLNGAEIPIKRLAGVVGYLRAGRIPDIIKDSVEQRRPNPGPTEEQHQRDAVAYVLACRRHVIDGGRAYTKMVAECFDVSPRTITRWADRWESSISLDGITGGIIEHRMRKSAAFYREAKAAQKADSSDI